jgi:predicted Zn-dependent peptidase
MTKFKSLIAAAVAISLVSVVVAQEGEREMPPPGGTPKDFTLPAKVTFGLDNGMQATMVSFGALPKATISVVVRVGNLNDGDQTWISDLSADFLLEGTTTRSAEEIAQAAAAMGGEISVGVDEDETTISADVLADFARRPT